MCRHRIESAVRQKQRKNRGYTTGTCQGSRRSCMSVRGCVVDERGVCSRRGGGEGMPKAQSNLLSQRDRLME